MGNWPIQQATQFDQEGIASPGATTGTLVTGGAANTKGAYATISAAIPFSAVGIIVSVGSKSATGDYLLDIAIGAAASESIIIPNLSVTGPAYSAAFYYFPIRRLPAGVRLAARCQSTSASATLGVYVTLIGSGFLDLPGFSRVEALGANTADSGGTGLTNPTVINTFPAWTQVAHPTNAGGVTSFRYQWIVMAIGNQNLGTRTSGQRFLFEAGVGAAGAQHTLLPAAPLGTPTGGLVPSSAYGFPCDIRAGSALWGRYSSAALTTLGADMILYGVG